MAAMSMRLAYPPAATAETSKRPTALAAQLSIPHNRGFLSPALAMLQTAGEPYEPARME
jgi:hypothetical protein